MSTARFTLELDDETKLLAMQALAGASPRAVEMWVDHRLCGRSGRELARQEGVTPNRIHQLVKQADQQILRHLRGRA